MLEQLVFASFEPAVNITSMKDEYIDIHLSTPTPKMEAMAFNPALTLVRC